MTTRTERLLGGYGGRMLASLAVAWAVLQTGRFLLASLLPAVIDDLGVTTVSAGIALGALQGIYALTQYPSGRLSDRFTRPALVVPGLATLAVAFLLLSVATSYALFLAGALVVGVGKGLYAVPSRALLSDLFVERRGQALGIYTAGTDIGGLVASGAAVLVTGGTVAVVGLDAAGSLSWRTPFRPLAAVLALAGVAYVAWNRDPYRIGRTALGLRETVTRLATTRTQREALVAFSLFYFVVGAWVNFLPTYLAAGKGFSESLAAAMFATVFVAGLTVKPLAGSLSDRVPRRLVGAAGLLVATAALVGVVLAGTVATVVAAIAVFAVGYKTMFPVSDAILLDAAPAGNLGGDLGAARALLLGVGALGPVYMGWAASTVGYTAAFVGLGGCLLAAAALLWRGAR